jgi:hypothetical protein
MASKKRLFIFLSVILLASLILPIIIIRAHASEDPLKLPTDPVIIEVENSTQAYFETHLSNVPSGYTVTNSTYLGWCVDQSELMVRYSPHTVQLKSSLTPTGDLANENWTMVNYVLNHKRGDPMDVQEAVWYFINMDGGYTPPSSTAQAMVNDAIANGTGFVPSENQKVAVICYPLALVPSETSVQMSIIEVAMPKSSTVQPTPTPSTSPQPTPQQSPTPPPQQSSQPSPTPKQSTNPQGHTPSSSPEDNTQTPVSGIIVAGIAGIAAVAILALLLLVVKNRKRR